jgi:hypothetical protein
MLKWNKYLQLRERLDQFENAQEPQQLKHGWGWAVGILTGERERVVGAC